MNDSGFSKKAAEVAEYLFLSATTAASLDFRAWRAAIPENKGEPGRLRMLGFSSQQADAYNAAFQESSSLCTVLLRTWCGAVGRFVPEQRQEIPVELSDTETLLTELNVTETTLPEHVMTLLRGDCGQEIEAFATEIGARLMVTIPADIVTGGQAMDFMQEQLSRKADAHDQRRTLHGIVSQVRQSLEVATSNTQQTIDGHLREILDSPHRLEGSRAAAHFAAYELQRTRTGCMNLVAEIEQTFASLATEAAPESRFENTVSVSAADSVLAFTKQYCLLLAYQTIYHCFVKHVESISASVKTFLDDQDRIQLELESVASEISTTQVLSSAIPPAIIDAFDRHLRSHDQTLVSTLASEDITIEEFRTRAVGEATHFLMSASDKYEGPSHTSGRKTYRFPEGAWSMIRGFGGDQRVLGLIPEWLDQVDWKGRLEQSFGNCVATRRVPHETISVVCEMSNVPVDTVMDRLTCNNPHVTDISGRIHTRTDVDW